MQYLSQLHEQAATQTRSFLTEYFARMTAKAHRVHPSYQELWSRMERVTLSTGKLLRPYLVSLGYHLGKNDTAITPIAAAHEMLHAALLIHDDIIDRDTIRHGEKNLTGIYTDMYATSTPDALHYANATSLIAGDLLLTDCVKLIDESTFSDAQKHQVRTNFFETIFEVAGGEFLDTEATFFTKHTYDPLLVYYYKTASYSCIAPLTNGALLANVSEEILNCLREYGRNLGLAYQIADDLLGVFGNEADTGKSTSSDLTEGKRTYLISQFETHANAQQKEMFFKHFGDTHASEQNVTAMRNLLIESKAKEKTEQAVAEYSKKAEEALAPLPDSISKTELINLLHILIRRNA